MIDQYPATVAKSIDLQQICQAEFGVDFTIQRIIADNLPSSKGSSTTIFETTSYEVYAYCQSDTLLTLRDIKHILRHVGVTSAEYIAPAHQPRYFTHFGIKAFNAAFPGRMLHADDDITFYESLAPYTPALAKVSEIAGELHQYDQALNTWHTAIEHSYKRIAVAL